MPRIFDRFTLLLTARFAAFSLYSKKVLNTWLFCRNSRRKCIVALTPTLRWCPTWTRRSRTARVWTLKMMAVPPSSAVPCFRKSYLQLYSFTNTVLVCRIFMFYYILYTDERFFEGKATHDRVWGWHDRRKRCWECWRRWPISGWRWRRLDAWNPQTSQENIALWSHSDYGHAEADAAANRCADVSLQSELFDEAMRVFQGGRALLGQLQVQRILWEPGVASTRIDHTRRRSEWPLISQLLFMNTSCYVVIGCTGHAVWGLVSGVDEHDVRERRKYWRASWFNQHYCTATNQVPQIWWEQARGGDDVDERHRRKSEWRQRQGSC